MEFSMGQEHRGVQSYEKGALAFEGRRISRYGPQHCLALQKTGRAYAESSVYVSDGNGDLENI